jgi:protoporphyrinogen oxidase
MKVAVIGAGFLGLSVAWELIKKGHSIEIFEKEAQPGGLAIGFKQHGWDWALEKHYHHIFESDKHIQKLADEIGHGYKFYDAKTYSLFENNGQLEYWRLDSPISLLKFSKLTLIDRIRMGAVLGYLRYLADWKNLEKHKAEAWLKKWMGEENYRVLWNPLMTGKFGELKNEVNLAWFWARVKARSQKLGYFDKGFLGLAQHWVAQIEKRGGKVHFNQTVSGPEELLKKFDKVIIAGAPKLVKQKVQYVGTVNLILQLKQKLLPQDIYWLNINVPNSPLLAVVEHTNLIDKSHYGMQHLVYLAKYLPHDHKYFETDDNQLLNEYSPLLTKINPGWKKNLIGFSVHKAKFTQPVMPINYLSNIPDFSTDNPNILSASMQQVYPWDRGTNFAIELGQKVAQLV